MKSLNNKLVVVIKNAADTIFLGCLVTFVFLSNVGAVESSSPPPLKAMNEGIHLDSGWRFGKWTGSFNLLENPFPNWDRRFIELLSLVAPQVEAVPKEQPKKKGNEADNDALLHWLFPVFTFLAGLYLSGYFSERTTDKKKPNVVCTSAEIPE